MYIVSTVVIILYCVSDDVRGGTLHLQGAVQLHLGLYGAALALLCLLQQCITLELLCLEGRLSLGQLPFQALPFQALPFEALPVQVLPFEALPFKALLLQALQLIAVWEGLRGVLQGQKALWQASQALLQPAARVSILNPP